MTLSTTMPQTPPDPVRSLAEICDEARLANCGHCWQVPDLPCVSHPETGADGYHLDRLVQAYIQHLVTGRELLTVLVGLGVFTKATVIYDDQDNAPQPHCATCGAMIGIFHGMDGWQHFRGDPAPGGQRELYDADHPADVVWGGAR